MPVHGHTHARFEPVRDAFQEGFDAGRDVGAALAVYLDGELVVDLWGGHTDRRREHPWREDTLVCLFSVTKAMTAVCLLQAVERGLLALDDPLARHWPELNNRGKGDITLRQALCHQAGLVGFHEPVSRDLLYDWHGFVHALETERPWWSPGTRHGYHARTFGFILGEVLRRVSGRTVGQWFRDEVAGPLDLDFAIGLPEADLARCADIIPARVRPGDLQALPPATQEMMQAMSNPATPTGAAFQNPAMGPGYANTRAFRTAEIPAANGHGTARAAARFYDRLGSLLAPELLAEATTTHSRGPDEVLKAATHFGLGFMLQDDETPVGLRPGTFGHAGAGGSVAFHDPEVGLSLCFAMNQLEVGVITGGVSAFRVVGDLYGVL